MRKLLFLDFDGVLNSVEHQPHEDGVEYLIHPLWHPELTKHLFEINSQIPELEIVISSSWRGHRHTIDTIFKNTKNTLKIIGATPSLRHQTRGEEINLWLEQNIRAGESFRHVILDDCFEGTLKNHFTDKDPLVFVDHMVGLTPALVLEVVSRLKGESNDN